MGTELLLLLRAVARRDARKFSLCVRTAVAAHSSRASNAPVDESKRSYSTLVREVESFKRFWDLGFKRGLQSEAKVEEKRRVGRPRKVIDGVEKVTRPKKPKLSMKKLELEIAENEAVSESVPKLTRVLAGAGDSDEGLDSSALINSLNPEVTGESSDAILASIVEDGELGLNEEVRLVEPPPAPRYPKLDLTSKQRFTTAMLDADDKGNERAAKIVIPEKYSDPKKVFLMLEEAKPSTFTSAEKARLSWIFHRFAESGSV